VRKGTKLGIAAVLSLAMVAAACGDDDEEGGGAETTAATETTAGSTDTTAAGGTDTTAGGGGGVELRWRTRPDNQAEIDLYQSISDSIDEANEGFSLKYEPGNNEGSPYQDQLRTELSAGTAPDVFWIPGTDIADFATKGLIMDLREMADATEGYSDDAFYPEPMAQLTFDPESSTSGPVLWGLPRDVSTFAVYLNLDLIAKAGADDPRVLAEEGSWTWDALKEVADKVAATGGANKGWGMNAWWANYGMFMNAAGGGFFNEDRTACALDTPESIAGLEYVTSLYEGTSSIPYGEDAEKPFNAGTLGMFLNGRWATPGARSSLSFNWDVVRAPDGPDGQGNWLFWGAYVVNAKTEHPEEAWALMQALTSQEVQSEISSLGANIPSRKSAEADEAFLTYTPPENNQAFLDGIQSNPTAEGPLWGGSWPAFDKAMNTGVEAVIKGSKSIDEYQATICNDTASAFTGG
jgi:multiple sugar transport system substrate-binding protein